MARPISLLDAAAIVVQNCHSATRWLHYRKVSGCGWAYSCVACAWPAQIPADSKRHSHCTPAQARALPSHAWQPAQNSITVWTARCNEVGTRKRPRALPRASVLFRRSPAKSRHALGWHLVDETPPIIGYHDPPRSVIRVTYNQHPRSIIRVLERDVVDAAASFRRSDAPSITAHETTGVRQCVVVIRPRDFAGRGIDCHHAAAGVAPAGIGAVVLVQCQVPEQHSARPVARGANHQRARLQGQATAAYRLPITARAFGQVDIFVRMLVPDRGLHRHVSVVAVPGHR